MNLRMTAFSATLVAALMGGASAASSANLLANGDFQTNGVGFNAYTYPAGLSDSWFFGGSAIARQSSAWNSGVPNPFAAIPGLGAAGDNSYAALQLGSELSQGFIAAAGAAILSWYDAGRHNFGAYDGDQTYEVWVNNVLMGTYATVSDTTGALHTLAITLQAGANEVTFLGKTNSGDHTAFIDGVSVAAVPGPVAGAGLPALLVVAGAYAAARRRKA